MSRVINQPKDFDYHLMHHQLVCIGRMQLLETKEFTVELQNNQQINLFTNNGILAEHGGCGKSQIVLGLVQSSMNIDDRLYKCIVGQWSFYRKESAKKIINTTLIIYPEHLKSHWDEQVNATKLKHHFIHKNNEMLQMDMFDRFDVVFISFNRIKNTRFDDYIFKRLVIDDADTVPNSKKIPEAYFRWLVTSDYPGFRNNVRFEPFKNMSRKEIDLFSVRTDYSCQMPVINYHEFLCDTEGSAMKFNFIPVVQRCLENKDYRSAILHLNGTIISKKDLKICISNEFYEKINRLKIPGSDIFAVHKYKEDRKSIKERVKNIHDNIDSPVCGICLSESEEVIYPTMSCCCKVMYCAECICRNQITWDLKCPLCRRRDSQLCMIDEVKNSSPSKLQVCVDLIKSKTGGIVVYTKDYSFYRSVMNDLKKKGIDFIQLDRDENGATKRLNDLDSKLEMYNGLSWERKVLLVYSTIPSGTSIVNTSHLVIDDNINYNYILDKMIRLDRDNSNPLDIYQLYREHDTDEADRR